MNLRRKQLVSPVSVLMIIKLLNEFRFQIFFEGFLSSKLYIYQIRDFWANINPANYFLYICTTEAVKKWQNLTLISRITWIFLIFLGFLIKEYQFRKTIFVIDIFWPSYFVKTGSNSIGSIKVKSGRYQKQAWQK